MTDRAETIIGILGLAAMVAAALAIRILKGVM